MTANPVETVLDHAQAAGRKVKKQKGGDYLISCPGSNHGHGDRNPSLHLSEGTSGNALLHCPAGCDKGEVLAALNLTERDLFAETSGTYWPPLPEFKPKLSEVRAAAKVDAAEVRATEYIYTDAEGQPVAKVERLDNYGPDGVRTSKAFRQYRREGNSWRPGLQGVSVPLYRLPDVLQATASNDLVLVVEGEKDADSIRAAGWGVAVTSCNGGANGWRDELADYLQGARAVAIVADRDAPGAGWARAVAESLKARAIPHWLYIAADGSHDASDHIAAGKGLDDLQLVESPEEIAVKESPADSDTAEPNEYPRLGQVLSLSDLEAMPPIREMVKGWIQTPTSAILVGKTGLGKSALALSWACSVASGQPFLGQPVIQGRVLVVIGEGSRGLPSRVKAWEKTWGTKVPEGSLQFMERPTGSLKDLATWRDLTEYCKAEGFRFVLIDTLSSVGWDIDETKDAPLITRKMEDLSAAIDGVAMLVHHTGWGNTDRARGSSSFHGNLGTILVMTAPTDGSPYLAVKLEKVKDGESGAVHHLRRIVVPLAPDADGTPRSSVTVEHARANDPAMTVRERVKQYLALCGEVGASRSEIAHEIGTAPSSGGLKKALGDLKAEGVIRSEGSTSASRYYLEADAD